MSDQNNPPAPETQPVDGHGETPPPPTSGPQPGKDTWEARYRGLSQLYESARKEHDATRAKAADLELQLTKVQADTGKALSQLQEQQALLQQDLAEKARVLAEKDSALAQAEAFKTKVKVLADFPRLGKLAHMIPETADEAAVRQACTELDKTVAEMIEQEVQGHVKQMAAGFTPGPAAVPTATSEFPYQTDEQWGKALFEASRNASLADYKKLDTAYTKWRQLRAKP